MIIDDIRKALEGMVDTLTPARAQRLAKDMLEPGAAKEQVAKTAADLLEWSHTNRERMATFVRREIADQMKAVGGVASQTELDALKKRVRDLERSTGKTASGSAKTKRTAGSGTRAGAKPAARSVTGAAAKRTTASSKARTSRPTAKGSASPSSG